MVPSDSNPAEIILHRNYEPSVIEDALLFAGQAAVAASIHPVTDAGRLEAGLPKIDMCAQNIKLDGDVSAIVIESLVQASRVSRSTFKDAGYSHDVPLLATRMLREFEKRLNNPRHR